jgi:predicted solute-binding protein
MWVNEMTVDCGAQGRRAVQELLDRGHDAGIIGQRVQVDFVEA